MKRLLLFCFTLCFLVSRDVIAAPEPIDRFSSEIVQGLRDLQKCKGTMTVKVHKHVPNSDYSPVMQEVTYRFVNDSVFVRSFTDRLFLRRSYFVLRDSLVLPFNLRKNCTISNETVTVSDSSGYTIEQRVIRSKKESTIVHTRSYTDTLRNCSVTLITRSDQPGFEEVREVYPDSTVTNEFRWQNGIRLSTKKIVYQKTGIGDLIVTEVFTTTTFTGDSVSIHEHKVQTNFQYYRSGRINYVSKIEYNDGSPEYSAIYPATFYYDE